MRSGLLRPQIGIVRFAVLLLALTAMACETGTLPPPISSVSHEPELTGVAGTGACPSPREPEYLPWETGPGFTTSRGRVSTIRSDSGRSYFVLERRADTASKPTSVAAPLHIIYGRQTYLLWTGAPGASEMSAWWEEGTGQCRIYHARLLLAGEPSMIEAEFTKVIGSIPAAFVDPTAGVTGLIAEIQLNVVPAFMAVMPSEQRLYVTDRHPALRVYDTLTNTLVGQAPLPLRDARVPAPLAVVPVSKRVYVLDFAGDRVLVLDGTTLGLLRTIPVNGAPVALAADREANRIYVVSQGRQGAGQADPIAGSVSVIDGAADLVTAAVVTPGHPRTIDVTGPRVYVGAVASRSSESSFIQVIDTRTNAEIALVGVSAPSMLIADTVDNVVYALSTEQRTSPSGATSKWIELDTRTNRAATFVDGPEGARALAWHAGADSRYRRVLVATQRDSGGGLLFYAPPNAGSTRLQRLPAELRTGPHPGAIAVDSTAHRIYVTSTSSKMISVIAQGPG